MRFVIKRCVHGSLEAIMMEGLVFLGHTWKGSPYGRKYQESLVTRALPHVEFLYLQKRSLEAIIAE